MTTRDNDVEQMCADLRQVLVETRHLDRRDFIAALGRSAAGAALMTAFAGIAPRRPSRMLVRMALPSPP